MHFFRPLSIYSDFVRHFFSETYNKCSCVYRLCIFVLMFICVNVLNMYTIRYTSSFLLWQDSMQAKTSSNSRFQLFGEKVNMNRCIWKWKVEIKNRFTEKDQRISKILWHFLTPSNSSQKKNVTFNSIYLRDFLLLQFSRVFPFSTTTTTATLIYM